MIIALTVNTPPPPLPAITRAPIIIHMDVENAHKTVPTTKSDICGRTNSLV